ncbi:MAG: hypothetical protein WD926_00505, partial [Patescibacteria group bacterium]
MLTALILIALVAGIVYAARRWPDVEARLFGVDKVDVPQSETAEPAETTSASETDAAAGHKNITADTAESVKEHARNAGRVADRTVHRVTEMAGGLFKKKPISEEPTVAEDVGSGDSQTDDDDNTPIFAGDPARGADAGADTAATAADPSSADDSDAPADTKGQAPKKSAVSAVHAPGERVGNVPARPSEPAYVDATRHQSGSFEQLSSEADQAWRDREYERCEEACLKILVQQPKNIKYMTRI